MKLDKESIGLSLKNFFKNGIKIVDKHILKLYTNKCRQVLLSQTKEVNRKKGENDTT